MISLWKAASRGKRAFLCAFGIDIPFPLRYNRTNKNLGGQNSMNFLEERIVKDGVVKAGNILKWMYAWFANSAKSASDVLQISLDTKF